MSLDILYVIQYTAVNGEPMTNESFENVILELRRGVIVLAVLSRLDQEQYGYSLIKSLADNGLEIDQGTLYPLLRRLGRATGLSDSELLRRGLGALEAVSGRSGRPRIIGLAAFASGQPDLGSKKRHLAGFGKT